MTQEESYICHEIKVLEHTCTRGNMSKSCRYLGIQRSLLLLTETLQEGRTKGLVNRRPGLRNPPWRASREIEKKAIHLCCTYHFGSQRIVPGSSNATMGWRSPKGGYAVPSPDMGSRVHLPRYSIVLNSLPPRPVNLLR